jgi:hypothetical protein
VQLGTHRAAWHTHTHTCDRHQCAGAHARAHTTPTPAPRTCVMTWSYLLCHVASAVRRRATSASRSSSAACTPPSSEDARAASVSDASFASCACSRICWYKASTARKFCGSAGRGGKAWWCAGAQATQSGRMAAA